MKSVGRRTGAGLLSEAEVNSAHHFALLVQVLQRGLHLPIQKHPSIDLDASFPVEVLRLPNGWDGCAKVTGYFVANFASLADLTNAEAGLFQPIVEDGVGALRRAGHAGQLGALSTTVWTVPRGSLRNNLFLLGHAFADRRRLVLEES